MPLKEFFGGHRLHYSGKAREVACKPMTHSPDLVHSDSCLDPRGYSVHPGTHPQEVDGLVLLPDGVLCMDPGCLHITLLDSLRNTAYTHSVTRSAVILWASFSRL